MSRRARVLSLAAMVALVIVAVLLAALGSAGLGRNGNLALAVLLIGALSLIGWKAVFEVASIAVRTAKRLDAASADIGRRFTGLEERATVDESATETLRTSVRDIETELRAAKDDLVAAKRELAATSSQLDADRAAWEELVERTTTQLSAEIDSTRSALADGQRELLGRLNRNERLAARNAALVEGERRARLAAASDDRPADVPSPSPAELRRLVDDVETGRIPLEHVSDTFPEEAIGLSGRKFRTLVCELVRQLGDRGKYLEIGTYHGKTMCTSALANPMVRHIGVDDFSQVDDDGRNRVIFEDLVNQLALANVDFVEQDFHEFLADRKVAGARDVSVYYFDASHDYRSQMLALLYGAEQVIEGGVMLVDDCNYSHVRAATYDFCDLRPEWALLFERYTEGHPNWVSDDLREQMKEGWWNGVHVLVHDPRHLVDRLPRPDEPELDRFFLAQHRVENCQTDHVDSRLARVHES